MSVGRKSRFALAVIIMLAVALFVIFSIVDGTSLDEHRWTESTAGIEQKI